MAAPLRQRATPKKLDAFLDALSRCGNVTEAATIAHVRRQTLYELRKSDPVFAAQWTAAAELGADALEDEAIRRAHDGVEKPLTCARGLILDDLGQPVTVREYSDTLLIFLLKGAKPEKYRDNVHVTAQASTLGVTLVLEQMRNDPRIADAANRFLGDVAAVAEAGR